MAKIEKLVVLIRAEDAALDGEIQRIVAKINEIIDRLNAIP